jgi:hypothetical protein
VGVLIVLGINALSAVRARAARWPRPGAATHSHAVASAPWGRLAASPFRLEKPAVLLPDAQQLLPPPRWHFPARTRAQTVDLLESCHLPAAQLAALTAPAVLTEAPDGSWLTPPIATVLELDRAARERIYAELEKSPHNLPQRHPFRIRASEAEKWLASADLSYEKLQLAHRLTYRRGHVMCFADTAVAQRALGAADFARLLRALYSSDTLLLRLRVGPQDSIERLAAYWGRGGRENELKVLLKSAANTGGAEVSVEELLPPLPRLWLYTYPDAAKNASSLADCFSSSLSFFSPSLNPALLQPRVREQVFRGEYRVVSKAEQLGDILVFSDAAGQIQHACVYLADDVVFTKNGAENTHPWILMRLDAVRALYSAEENDRIVVFRRRDM